MYKVIYDLIHHKGNIYLCESAGYISQEKADEVAEAMKELPDTYINVRVVKEDEST
jgi:hypothetical protein